jgi:hypothetical protein
VTWIKGAVGVYDSDDEFGERVIGVAGAFDERFSEEEGEVGVAVVG